MNLIYAGVAELADAPDLGSGFARSGGSSPFTRTILRLSENFVANIEESEIK